MMVGKSYDKKKIAMLLIAGTLLVSAAAMRIHKQKSDAARLEDDAIDVSNVTVNEQFFSSMSEKEAIHYRIMNSIDFFDTATGMFERNDMKNKLCEKVNYAADVKNRRGYVHITNTDNDENSETICNNGKKLEFDNIKKTYREFNLEVKPKDENMKKLKPENRYSKKKGYVSRNDNEFLVGMNDSLFNQDYLVSELKDYDSWDTEGEESYLNRTCVKIKGKLGFTDKNGGNNFKALVDKSTGILMKYEKFNKNGEVVSSLVTKSIKINEGVDSKAFEKDAKGYAKVDKVESDKK